MRDRTHQGDTNNTVKDSHADRIVQARDIENYHEDNKKPFALPTDNSKESFYIAVARWLLDKNSKELLFYLGIPSLASIYIFLDWFIFKIIYNVWLAGIALAWTIMLFMALQMIWKRKCPKCQKPAAMKLSERQKIDSTEYQGNIWYDIREVYVCDYCKHEEVDEFQEKGPSISN